MEKLSSGSDYIYFTWPQMATGIVTSAISMLTIAIWKKSAWIGGVKALLSVLTPYMPAIIVGTVIVGATVAGTIVLYEICDGESDEKVKHVEILPM